MKTLKRWLPDLLVVLLFAAISFVYFFPADIEGRILYRHDSSAGRGAGEELTQYYQRTGERSRWTNSLFSGMPTYQMSPSYDSSVTLTKISDAYDLWLPVNVNYVFLFLLGFYILLRAFDFRRSLAALGAVIWAFSSYFFIIIAAGHIWKVMALVYLPPMIAGIVLAYRGKYLWGFVLTAIFSAFEINANHVQMTYYYLFAIFFMVIAFLVDAIRKHRLAAFGRATAVCAAGAVIGICLNLSNLYHTWQYQKESMRGKSELVKQGAGKANQTNSGLDRDYITQWSYGIGETWTLLVPNAKGGSHNEQLGQSEAAMAKCSDPQLAQMCGQWYQYWGDQPFTAGPVYVGAFVLMLFILGLFIVRGPMKWALLAATVLSIMLSWGRNFMPLTDFFIDYMPMYSKFRTVSSILVIAEFTIPLLAMLALKRIVDEPDILRKKAHWLWLSFVLTAGVAVVFALMPNVFFDFVSDGDKANLSKYLTGEYQAFIPTVLDNLSRMRVPIFTADCWRSVLIIAIGTASLLLFRMKRINATAMVAAVAVLCLFDMWQVNKRYLNDGMFVERSVRDTPQTMTAADQQILQDKSPDYRVLNLASNTFNENETSFYHKSIGGYHAAKLRRYQELIDAYIAPEMGKTMQAVYTSMGDMTKIAGDSIFPVLNMLNTKYFILPLQGGQTMSLQNPYTYGNAWLVDRIGYAANANEEIDRLGKIDLRHEAVADAKFKDVLGEAQPQTGTSVVTLKTYEPNALTYEVKSDKGGIVVFSEIYYPGWTATVDGKETQLGRVDYVLRAMRIEPGTHNVQLTFKPKSVKQTETIAFTAFGILLLAIAGGCAFEWHRRKKLSATDGQPKA